LWLTLTLLVSSLMRGIITLNTRLSIQRTAVVLILYLLVHVGSNSLFLLGREVMDQYYIKLGGSVVMRVMKGYLVLAGVLHVLVGSWLTFRFKRFSGRGGLLHKVKRGILALTGGLILAFTIWHWWQFEDDSEAAPRPYDRLVHVFACRVTTAVYVMAMSLLGVHLWKGWAKTLTKYSLTGQTKASLALMTLVGQVLAVGISVGFSAVALLAHLQTTRESMSVWVGE